MSILINSTMKMILRFYLIIKLITLILGKRNEKEKNRKLELSSEILVKIKGKGNQTIINSNFLGTTPDIYLNENLLCEKCKQVYNLEGEENILILKYDNGIDNFYGMFDSLENLIEVNFSNIFPTDFSSMSRTFYKCKNLKYINISKFNNLIKIHTFSEVFFRCDSLLYLDLSGLDTSIASSMSGLFKDLQNLIYLDISSFNTEIVSNMQEMFYNCKSLEFLNLSYFKTENLNNMHHMFYGCESLTSIDLSSFDTQNVENMDALFNKCYKIESLDLSNFITTSLQSMQNIFCNCQSLTYLNILSFDTSQIQLMGNVFLNCSSLSTLDLSNFRTSSAFYFTSMFEGCKSLKSLDLSSFETSSVFYMEKMFKGCTSLESLNLSSFDTTSSYRMYGLFEGCESLTSLDLSNFDISHIPSLNTMFKDCKSLISVDLSNFDMKEVTSVDEMFLNCINLEYINFGNSTEYKTISTLNTFSGTPINIVYCINEAEQIKNALLSENGECSKSDCSDNWKENQIQIIEGTNSCLQDSNDDNTQVNENGQSDYNTENAPTDINEDNIDNSQNKENTDNASTNTNEDTINEGQSYLSTENTQTNTNGDSTDYNQNNDNTENNPTNIRENIENQNQSDNSNNKNEVNQDDNKSNDNKENTKENICHAKSFFEKLCKINKNNIEERVNMAKIISSEIMDGSMSELLLEAQKNNKNLIISDLDIYEIQFLSDKIFDSDNNNISSIINLDQCQQILREKYHFNDDEDLILFMIEYFLEGFNIPIIEYEIFSPNGTIKLDLDYCKDLSISLYIPVDIDENNLYLYDPKSDFYNDRCNPYTTESGTDMTIYDRKNEFNYQNKSLCENNCEYKEYNFENKKVECECKIKTETRLLDEIKGVKPVELLNNFRNIKQISNIGVIKCYKLLFTKDGILNNIGSYILIFIIFITIIDSILFCSKGYKLLFLKIKEIYKTKFNKKESNIDAHDEKNQTINKNNENNNFPPKKKIKIKKRRNKKSKSVNIYPINSNSNINFQVLKKNNIVDFISNEASKPKLNDYELNSLSYEEALKYDKRTYMEYYLSLIRTKQLIIFSFFPTNDYNSKLIKICLFFFSFSLYYTVNALFFNDSTMHKIYKDKGAFDFLFQLPKILYSTIISAFIKKILTILSLTEKHIVEIKNEKTLELATDKMKKLIKCLTIKFSLFFIIDFLLLILFWYYISCFCAVYRNTQVYLIKNTITSFFTSLLYPFAFNIIPSLVRITALKNEKHNKACVYKISKILQIF